MKTVHPYKSKILVNQSREGVSIEKQIEAMVNNKEKIGIDTPIVYTPRNEGVLAAYNIRSDRFDIALDAMDKINKSYGARRDAKMEIVAKEEEDGKPEPIQGTSNK